MAGQGTPGTSKAPTLDAAAATTWPVLLFVGLATLVLGVVLLAWPGETLTVLSILLGIQLVVFGVFRLIGAFSRDALEPWLEGLVGVLSMVIGVVVLRHPFETVAVLATLLGVVWIVGGSIDLIGAITDDRRSDRGVLVISGLLAIAAGLAVVIWPAPTVTVIAWISGLFMILTGLILCMSSFRLRSEAHAGS